MDLVDAALLWQSITSCADDATALVERLLCRPSAILQTACYALQTRSGATAVLQALTAQLSASAWTRPLQQKATHLMAGACRLNILNLQVCALGGGGGVGEAVKDVLQLCSVRVSLSVWLVRA